MDSALRLILHNDQIPVPTFTHLPQIDDEDLAFSSDLSQDQQEDSEFQLSGSTVVVWIDVRHLISWNGMI